MPSSPPNQHLKTDLRRLLRARRNALSDAQRDQFSARIATYLKSWLLSRDDSMSTIAIYEAQRREVDLSALCALDFEFAVPRRVGESWIDADETEVFGPHPNPPPQAGEGATLADSCGLGGISSLSRLRGRVGVGADHFAVPQMLAERFAPSQIDIFFVPGLAYDSFGHRIGQGGGWYDRVLSRAPHSLKIGVAFECQIIENVPHEAHDVKMDGVVTESGLRFFVRDHD